MATSRLAESIPTTLSSPSIGQSVLRKLHECHFHDGCWQQNYYCSDRGTCKPCTDGCNPDSSVDGSCAVCRTAAPSALPSEGPKILTPVAVENSSFEEEMIGWTTSPETGISGDELAAAPHRSSYLRLAGGGENFAKQTLEGVTVTAGQTYVAKVWARSVNPPSVQNSAATIAKIHLRASSSSESTAARVEAPLLSAVDRLGSKTDTNGDDGVNVWFDNGYRMHAAQWFYYQQIDQDPFGDKWVKGKPCGDGMANGPILVPKKNAPKALYDTFYTDDDDNPISRIEKVDLKGKAPNYKLANPIGEDDAGEIFQTILSHKGDQNPWVIDAHLTYDDATDRLWMAWGGHSLWVTEMDPKTGQVLGNPDDPEFDTHPSSAHRCVAAWEPRDFQTCAGADQAPEGWDGDVNGVAYHEGPSLYKKDKFWYFCGSYGSMGFSYTIRCCRSRDPDGPFEDKDGIGCTKFDKKKNRFGASMLLGPEGHQAVPGHPHMWAEADGKEYLGYDFRKYQNGKSEDNEFKTDDEMGIRRLYWVDGWPTIWTPLTVKFVADEHPDAIGDPLWIELGNDGTSSSIAAFDLVQVYTAAPAPTPTMMPAPGPISSSPTTTDFKKCLNKATASYEKKEKKIVEDFETEEEACESIKKKKKHKKCLKEAKSKMRKNHKKNFRKFNKKKEKCEV